MPRNKAYRMSKSVTHIVDTPFEDEQGEALPCWRCGKNTGELVGKQTTALVLNNVREQHGDKKYWTIQTEGEEQEPKFKEIVLNQQNYHRSCDNAYQRARRASKNTQIKTLKTELERMREELASLANVVRQQPLIVQQHIPAREPPRPRQPTGEASFIDPTTGRYVKAHTNNDMSHLLKGDGSDAQWRAIVGLPPDPRAELNAIEQERKEIRDKVNARIKKGETITEQEAERMNARMLQLSLHESELTFKLRSSSHSEQDDTPRRDE